MLRLLYLSKTEVPLNVHFCGLFMHEGSQPRHYTSLHGFLFEQDKGNILAFACIFVHYIILCALLCRPIGMGICTCKCTDSYVHTHTNIFDFCSHPIHPLFASLSSSTTSGVCGACCDTAAPTKRPTLGALGPAEGWLGAPQEKSRMAPKHLFSRFLKLQEAEMGLFRVCGYVRTYFARTKTMACLPGEGNVSGAFIQGGGSGQEGVVRAGVS